MQSSTQPEQSQALCGILGALSPCHKKKSCLGILIVLGAYCKCALGVCFTSMNAGIAADVLRGLAP